MDEISKKDLLKETGISYGQLYRWKREALIPEEWFVKRPSFTGQETFFPRERTVNRVRAILALKDSCSLEEIRERLRADGAAVALREGLAEITGAAAAFWARLDIEPHLELLAPEVFACVLWVYEAGLDFGLRSDRLIALVGDTVAKVAAMPSPPAQAVFFETGGEPHFLFVGADCPLACDDGLKGFRLARVADALERVRASHPALFSSRRP
ncbi:MAG: YhbD family protein [Clostridiales Family XIII bacterium]|nr:YhbD family protein [Clostridiales Family XIII bacterium]